jgi:dTDP-4-amino-4,6-dideoxy-D-galactose acyltransferase
MKQQKLTKLEWDSNFFDFNVARIEGLAENEIDAQNIEHLITQSDTKLSYYSSFTELPQAAIEGFKYDVQLVDKKTTYSKRINSDLTSNKSIFSVDENTVHKAKLIDLAIQSGVYSRFNVDKKIDNLKFKELYGLWMTNSLSRKIAKEVIVFEEEDLLAGFVTLGEKNNRADIGIIAVDHPFRGRGIGKKLMQSAEKWFSDLGYSTIQVVTQGENTPACMLYEGCGYQPESIEYFYHIWKE